ncbi:hypothetical protein EDM76_06960 [bacterium]|nr:MAG: hypothetical protein EDM76_06960 [bacterium]MCL4230623.1 flagellar biosynthetic protein FliO [Dehalococcoidia bacterium]
MNGAANRRRVLWLALIGGVLLLSVLFVTLLAPSPGPASTSPVIRTSETAGSEEQPATEPRSSGFSLGGGDIVSLGLRLGLVAVIIAASIFALRWWGRKTLGPKSASGFLRVVDTLAVGNGRTIHLVALGQRVIAVGATAQQLSYLAELTDDESHSVLETLPRPTDQSVAGFAAELFNSMRRDTSRQRPLPAETIVGGEPQ